MATRQLYPDMSTLLDFLFPGSVGPLKFPEVEPIFTPLGPTHNQEIGFSFRRPLSMVAMSIRYKPIKKHENDLYRYEYKIRADRIIGLLSPFQVTRLGEIVDDIIPNWVVVAIKKKLYRQINYDSNAEEHQVYIPYLRKLLEMLNSKNSLPYIHDQIIEKGVQLTFNRAELEPDTELQNIRLFDDPIIKSRDLEYDVTAILFSFNRDWHLLKIPPMGNMSFGPLTIEMRDCVNYQMVELERAYDIFEEYYGNRLRDNYMLSIDFFQKLFSNVCKFFLGIEDAKLIELSKRSHLMAVTRSLDGTYWNFVNNKLVHKLEDLRLFLEAIRHEKLRGIFYSKRDIHNEYVARWTEIVRQNS
ncbi:hypothetical protein SNEBB_000198 [Seison nebaliae]|nr:hypothetical protein SNEBB_000198 [Seison nebaliae]